MKRVFMFVLMLALVCGCAMASAGYNSFFDNELNAGYYDNKAWDGEYVYWLDAPDDNTWNEYPNNIYRMRPGDEKAEMILEGREDRYIFNFWNIGDRLLLAVYDGIHAEFAKPALIDFDGGNYRVLSGRIGSVVLAGDVLFNSIDGHVYEVDLSTMERKHIYSYPEEIAAKNPILYQFADDMLYFSTDTHEIYSFYRYVDEHGGGAHKKADCLGSWFVHDGFLYMSDHNQKDGTWKCSAVTGNRIQKLSDDTYTFYQGYDRRYIRALPASAEGWTVNDDAGVIIDINLIGSGIENAIIGSCNHYYDAVFGEKIIRYDWENNRMYIK